MHGISFNDKQEGRKMGWHLLTEVRIDLTLANCHLNPAAGGWDYVERTIDIDGKPVTSLRALGVTDDAKELDENDKPTDSPLIIGLPYNRGSFKPITNAKLISLLEKATEGKDLVLDSCGTVKNRGRQFFSFALGETYSAGGREFAPYFNVGNGNDKSSPLWENTSTTCTVCNNTFEVNLVNEGMIAEVKKTKFSELKVADFGKAAKVILAGHKEFADLFEGLALIKCNENEARNFFAGFVGKLKRAPLSTQAQNNVDRLVALFKGGAGNNGENYADVFSALTDYLTHESASGKGDNGANWKNYVSSEFGSARNEKIRAWVTLTVEGTRQTHVAMGGEILKLTAEENAKK